MKKVIGFFFMIYLMTPLLTHAFEIFKVDTFKGSRAILLKDGVGYYYEKTRPPTEEETRKRVEWFQEEWKKLKERMPEFEKAISEGDKASKEKLSQKPPPPFLREFFTLGFKLFKLIAKEGVKLAEPMAMEYFSKAPVVVEAGFVIKKFNGSSYSLKLDLTRLYQEEWKRLPSDGIYPLASIDGRYVALVTESDFGKIKVFKIDKGTLEPLFEVLGTTPIAFSPKGSYFAYTTPNRSQIIVVNKEGKIIRTVPLKYRIAKKGESEGPVRIALSENHLGVINWIGIKVVDLKSGEEREVRLRGGKSILFNRQGDKIYANTIGEIFIYDLESLNLIKKLDYFFLKKRGVHVHYLASLSPEENFLALLYDPSTYGEKAPRETSVLLVYDLERNIVTKRFENLETITGGFGGVFLPASFSNNWEYLLLGKKGDLIELYKIEPFRAVYRPLERERGKKFCQSDSDCVCGVDKETGLCDFGNREFIDPSKQCPDFCTGIHGRFRIKCINNLCDKVFLK